MTTSRIVTFKTKQGKNDKLNYSRTRFNSRGEKSTVRATKDDFDLFSNKAQSTEVIQEGDTTIYNFTMPN